MSILIHTLKCSKGTKYGKFWYQNKCWDDHFHVFLAGEIKKILYKLKEMTLISCYKSLLKERSYSHDT